MEVIPDDLRHLKDFPTFDSNFQDRPNFRQNLSHWALETDKIATALTTFADGFQQFHSSGLEHLAASTRIMNSMQEMSTLGGSSTSALFSKLAEQMGSVLKYYDVFLGHTELLNVVPIKKLAATFSNLKKIYAELQLYRSQYIRAAEELCSIRHVSNLIDKTNFNKVTEECYTAQKTYKLLLTKYLTALRQANTKDMVTILRSSVDHILSQFVYYKSCSTGLGNCEQEVNTMFYQTKQWSEFYTNELVLWGNLHNSIQRDIMAELQLEMGLVHQQSEEPPPCSKFVKPILKMMSLPHSIGHGSMAYDTKSHLIGTRSPLEDAAGRETKSPPVQSNTVSNFNGAQVISNEFTSSPVLDREEVSPRYQEESPRHHVVSRPVHLGGEVKVADAQFNLQTLIRPANKNWVKCGYLWLWLQMKVPDGRNAWTQRYVWTHIYCVVDKERGELMIQEQSLPEPRKLENLMLCNTKPCIPTDIDRNFCFKVITPSSEHLFQTINQQQMNTWVSALQETTEEALKHSDPTPKKFPISPANKLEPVSELVPDAMNIILDVPGNHECADCGSTAELEWTSVNLGIVICIKCSGIHRGLGVQVSKVKSLNLDKWDKSMVEFMQSQGNTKSNGYYESSLEEGLFTEDIRKPTANASEVDRKLFIQQKYVALAFVPECGDTRSTRL